MKQKLVQFIIVFNLAFTVIVKSQNIYSIPAFTAYAIPAEENNNEDESKLFSQKNGLHNWTNTKQEIQFYFNLRNIGNLSLSLLLKNDVPDSKLAVSIAGKKYNITVPKSVNFKKIIIANIEIKEPGFYILKLTSVAKKGKIIADIKSLEISGEASKDLHFNPKPRRNAASVHLLYPVNDSIKVLSFYNEITIPKDADILHSYYMACGFARGYFGIQVNSPTERRVIFSIWDAGNERENRNKVAVENKVQLMAKMRKCYY